jgi:sialic acid synthase
MKHTYVIGEIGQNHNGSVIIAKEIIDRAAKPVIDPLFNRELKSMDAVKLTKRDLKEELSATAMLQPYHSKHSFGETYGEHREALELNDEEHFEIYKYTKEKGLDFVETLCGVGCTSMFRYFEPDRLKVASRDLTNLPLLNVLAETKIPIILSTGMGGPKELDEALEVIAKHHNEVSILHCLSQYPSDYENINLLTIPYLKKKYPDFTIGYSDHSIGIVIPVAAVTLGAEIIEKHITLDREMRGTDQAGSLAPDGVYRMMRDIRNLEKAFGTEDMFVDESVKGARIKLERSIASTVDLKKGQIITESDLHMLSPGDGFKWSAKNEIIGKALNVDLPKDEVIYPKMLS